jgi:thiol:disulfide interchange protein
MHVTKWCRILLLMTLGGVIAPVQGAATKARLVLGADTAKAGETVMAGVVFKMNPGWHIYWRNSGESGIPTRIDWVLPAGVTAGEIQWPTPEKYGAEGVTTYVYHKEVVLLVPLKLAADVPAGPLALKAKVSWLECETQCVPGRTELNGTLTVGGETKASGEASLLETWRLKIPGTADAASVRAWWEKPGEGENRPLIVEWAAKSDGKEPDFFGYKVPNLAVKPSVEVLSADAGKVRVRKLVNKSEGEWPAKLTGLLVSKTGSEWTGAEATLAISDAPVTGTSTPQASTAVPAGGTTATPSTVATAIPAVPLNAGKVAGSLLGMLGLAFLGGLILNIMPCVLPVIALKIFGFVQQSKEAPGQVRKLGFIYGLGVLASFLVLASLVIGVQKAGRAASWGMQFQNPQFLVVMTTLVTLVALNLFGLFEVVLGGRTMSAAGELASKEGNAGAFFNGVLATALATPCTAPFLAAALGFAFAQSPGIIILVFATIGLGLAAPYVLLSWQPAWLKFLPKPGAWMEKFKIAMGFPMLATAVWMFSLAAGHFGKSGALWLGIYLVVLALAAWIFGEFFQRGSKRRGLALAVSFVLLAVGYGYALERELHWRSPARVVAGDAGEIIKEGPDGIEWRRWSPEAVAKAREAGQPVLVDFTADWCLTCQVNKKTSIEIPSVRAKLKAIKAVALLGDHTQEDARITEELKRHERAGVPLVLVFPRDPKAPVIVLPEVLTPNIMLEALDKAK